MRSEHQVSRGSGWQLAGSGPAAYEEHLVPVFFKPWAEQLLDLAEVARGERVLDVACGTGIVARVAAARVGPTGQVAGLDLNEAMLAAAKENAKGLEVEWKSGDAAKIPFPDNAFDVALCQQAMQFFPDPARVLSEMRRVVGASGRIGLNVLRPIDRNPAYGPLADALARHAGVDVGAMMRSPFPKWDREGLRALVKEAGFRDVRMRLGVMGARYPSAEEFIRREAASSPLAAHVLALPGNVIDALVKDVEAAVAPFTDDDGVAFPMETWFVIARP